MISVLRSSSTTSPASVRAAVGRGIAVAGTATSLAALEQRLDAYDRERVDGYTLRRDSCERLLELLAGCSLDQRRELRGLDPKRAPTIVAGAAILVEALAAFDLRQVLTSEADILQGVALAPRDIPV